MSSIEIKQLEPDFANQWDEYVLAHSHYNNAFLSHWKGIIEKTFGHKGYYLYAWRNGKITGILPLIHLKSRLFGNFLISMPFLNYGGILADTEQDETLLLAEATKIAQQLKTEFIELRHVARHELDLPNKQHKISMLLSLPSESETLWANLKAKVRNQVRKAEKSNLRIAAGQLEKLPDFYEVFARNMRDLGTPVYPQKFFANILRAFEAAKVFVAYLGQTPVAAGFVIGINQRLEIPWASSVREFNSLNGNMFLYWQILKYACESGYAVFDFGRCTPDENTYRFKKQWGAEPVELNWQYWLRNGNTLPDLSPRNKKYELMIQTWQKLPVGLTKIIGPWIIRNIP